MPFCFDTELFTMAHNIMCVCPVDALRKKDNSQFYNKINITLPQIFLPVHVYVRNVIFVQFHVVKPRQTVKSDDTANICGSVVLPSCNQG